MDVCGHVFPKVSEDVNIMRSFDDMEQPKCSHVTVGLKTPNRQESLVAGEQSLHARRAVC
eukprot:1195579-Prorocentrum_minimum.AAC.2